MEISLLENWKKRLAIRHSDPCEILRILRVADIQVRTDSCPPGDVERIWMWALSHAISQGKEKDLERVSGVSSDSVLGALNAALEEVHHLVEWRNRLVQRYPTASESLVFAHRHQLDLNSIAQYTRPTDLWTEVVRQARTRNLLWELEQFTRVSSHEGSSPPDPAAPPELQDEVRDLRTRVEVLEDLTRTLLNYR